MNMLIQYLLIVHLLTPLVITQEDSCLVYNQQVTNCTELRDCAVALKQLKEKQDHDLQKCGYNESMQMVCCPQIGFGKPRGNDDGNRINIRTGINIRIAERACNDIINTTIPFLGDHILHGEPASIGEFPHMVGLGYLKGEIYDFDCGGSLVSLSYVLTAGHCVVKRIAPTIVRGGVIQIGIGEWNSDTDRRIEAIIKHPNYNRPENYHDLALMRLEKPFELSSNLNAICLETSNADPEVPLIVTGWGKIFAGRRNRSKTLLKADIKSVARDECNKNYSGDDWLQKLPRGIIPGQICAADPEGQKDTCEGDSGGPLMTTTYKNITEKQIEVAINRLVGLTSFAKACGGTQPAVYTRVSRYLDWIEDVVWLTK